MGTSKGTNSKSRARKALVWADLSDVALARRFVARHGHEIRYCSTWRSWLSYDGRKWDRDSSAYKQMATETVTSLRSEPVSKDSSERAKVQASFNRCESIHTITAITKQAQSELGIVVRAAELDADPMLLNCLNGVLDLRTGNLRTHSPALLLTRLSPTEYDANATCPNWEKFLHDVMLGNSAHIAYLRRLAGYLLTGSVAEHGLYWLHGTGRNGKGAYVRTLRHVLGCDYSMQAANNFLLARSSPEHSTEEADLEGRRLVYLDEPTKGKIDEARVKKLTGGDNIRARPLYEDFHEFTPTHKMVVTANHQPTIIGKDEGIWSRLHFTKFPVHYSPAERVLDLEERLLHPEASGILAWAVRGCLEYRAEGLNPPADFLKSTREYRAESNPASDFIGERCDVGVGLRCGTVALFRAYETWCYARGEDGTSRLSSREFVEAVESLGHARLKSNGTMQWDGLAPKSAEALELEPSIVE